MKKIARLLVLTLLFSIVFFNLFWEDNTVSAEDGAAPVFAEGYPQTASVTETNLDLQIKMNKKGTAYYKIVSAGAPAPTSAEVKNDGASVEVSAVSAETVITGLNDPTGVAVDGEGNIYAADKGNKRVCKYDPEGTFLDIWTLTGFNDPWGVTVDDEGNIYVSDDGTANPFPHIKKYGSDGEFVCQWGAYGTDDGLFNGIRGIAADHAGYVYSVQWNNSRIQKFTADGVYVAKWGAYGSGNGEFCNPTGVAADGNGNVYVADYWNHRIQKFTSGGVFITKWGSNGTGNGQFFKPSGITIDPDGNVYVTDFGQHRVQKFEPDGDFIAKWGKDNCTSGSGEEEFNGPFAAAADESGNVYVADRGNNRIQRLCCKATANVSGLAEGVAYDIYVTAVGEDGSLQQAPEKIEVTMAGTPSAPAAPIADPSAGAVVAGTVVTLTCATDGAAIYYTTDGSEPTTASTEYSGPIVINADVTIKAVAAKEGMENSDVLTAEYTVVAGDEVYVSTSGNDDNDGYSWAAAKQTIKSGIDTVTAGGTVTVADGTYKGGNNRNITIGKNITIKGQSRDGAVIDGENSSRIFTIENGKNVTIRDLTLSNAVSNGNGGVISNSGTLTVAGCAFINNAAAGFFGGGAIYNSGNITVTDSIFTDNSAYYGGSIYNANISSTVTGCTFSGNTAQYGGAVYNQSVLAVTGSTFTGNSASPSSGGAYGGAFYNDYSGNLTVIGSTLNENIADNDGGALYNNGTASLRFCRILANNPQDIYNGGGSVDANKNFWGSNGNPFGKVSGTTISTWLVLTLTAEPAAIHTGETSIVTADLLHDQTGAYHNPAEGHVPDGISVTFDTTDPSPPGSLDPSSGALADGRAASNFTADALGTANITATVNDETVSLTIVIESMPLGTENNPYPITTVTELEQVRADTAAGSAYWYKLMNDLDLSGVAGWTPIGDDAHPFKGHFDGNNRVIRNLSIGGTGGANIGLFGCTSATAGIEDLGLENVDIDLERGQYVGGLVGQNKGTIDSCSVTGVVHIDNTDGCEIVIGGLVGLNYSGNIGHSHSAADVAGTAIVGGLAGGNTKGSIINCGATGNVSAASYQTGETAAGGLVGANSGGSISGCYAAGNVSGQGDGVGGLVGGNGNDDSTGSQGYIINCYATGDVSNFGDGTGGLAGGNDTGSTIDDCYATGAVSSTGQGTGALVGGNSGSISRSYALTGGSPLVGYSDDDGTVTGSSLQSSANLRKQATFSGWNFSAVWGVTEDRGYPSLAGVSAAPAVIRTIPADGAAGVSPDQTISITFSEKIQAGTGIHDITFNGTAIGYNYTISGNVLTLDPASGLAGDYTVTVPTAAVESLQAIPPAADCSFSFTTSQPDQYTLTVIKVGNGGTNPGVGDHSYYEGTVVDLTADPAPGWTFSRWSGDVDSNGHTVIMDGDKSVTATFEENAVTHTITASALTGGSISPSGVVPVNEGSGRTFNITPDSGYIIEDVLVDYVSQGRINSYTFNNVTTGHAIEATFTRGFEVTAAANWSAVTAGSGAGGQPGPADTIIIKNGATLTVDVADGLAGTIQLGEAGASGGEGTLRFLAGKSITANSLLLGNGDIGGNVNMSAGGTLRISGSITNINYYGTWTHGTGTVEYCGGDQTVQGRSYYNLVTSGSGAKILTDSATIYGNLTVGSGTTLYLDNSSANHNLPASGTLTLQDNAALLINSGNAFPANYITYSLAAGSTVNYNRSGIQNITARTYGNLTLSGSGTKTLQSNTVVNGNLTIGAGTTLDTKQNSNYSLTVGGDWTNNGSFNAWAGTVTLGGAATHSLGGSEVTSFNNLTLSDTVNASKSFNAGGSGTGTLTVNSGAVLNPAANVVINENGPRGALTGSGTIKVTRTSGEQHMYNQYNLSTFSLANMTVEYAASDNQNVWYPGNSYGNLVLSGGGTKKPLSPLSVSGNLTIGGGVTLNQNSMDITVGGNWTNNGSFTASNYAVTLNGAGAQEITGPTTFRKLTLNNAAGLTIHSDVTITDALALTSGRITTGANKVILAYASGSISGANSSNYIVGGLQKIIAAGAATRTFEVGTAVSYNPVTVAFGNVAAAGNLTVKAAAGDHPSIGASTIDPARSVNVYWTMANSGTVFDSCNATFNFTAGNMDAGASTDNFMIGKYDGSAWTYPDIGAQNAVSTQATGMTSLSDFVLGESRAGDIDAPTVADGTIAAGGLTDTSVTLSWAKATDDISAQGELQYLVCRSDSSNIDTVVNIEANGTAIGTYASDIDTKEITGLTAGTTYYFNVIVKDEAGNKTAYTMKAVTTQAASLPVMGGIVTVNGTAKYGETLTADISGITYIPITAADVPTYQWKRGIVDIAGATASAITLAEEDIGQTITVTVTADGVHAAGSVTSVATGTVEKADGPVAPVAPTLVSKTHNSVTLEANTTHEFGVNGGSWQDSNVFTGLSPEIEYTFTARVKETATHKASAASDGLSVTTDTEPVEPDTTPPTVTDGTISSSGLTDSSVTLSWAKATDDVSIQEALLYLVYRSDFNNIETVENTEVNGTTIGIYATDIDTKDIIGLISSTTYYFNVIVRDEAGNKTAYTMKAVTTATAPAVTYTVTYDSNGGTGTAPTEGDKAEGATFAAADNSFTAPSSKQFKEWNTAANGTGTSYLPGATVTMPASNLILYAVWEDIPAPSENADLSSLAISAGTLTPGFDPAETTYSVSVGGSVSSINVKPITADSKATVTVNGNGVASGNAKSVSLSTGDNIITIVVTAENGTTKTYKITVNKASSGDSGGNSGGSTQEPSSASSATVNVNGNTVATATTSLDSGTGTVTAVLNADNLNNVLTEAKADEHGIVTVNIGISKTVGANSYVTELPTAVLTTSDKARIEIKTEIGTITVPGNMLDNGDYGAGSVGISIGTADTSGFDEELKARIGDKPVIELKLTSGRNTVSWNNPDAPVTVSIPYTPTAEESANPDAIVIWYIDGSGNAVSVPDGRYDPVTGTVTFTTTHFSCYAVSYNQVSFKDVAAGAWYAKAVSFIAAREITTGTGNGNFSPEAKLTRGQFVVMLMKAYGIAPDASQSDNFADAGSTWYTSYLAAAKRLGISAGVGNNLFAPEKEITRQEMFALLYNALKTIGKLPRGNSGKTVSDFSDAGDIAPWAKDAMTLLVETVAIGGSGGKLTPADTTNRTEMAQVLYNLLSQ